MAGPDRLGRGDLLPRIRTSLPGPEALAACERLRDLEPPGINTLYGGAPNILWQEARGSNVLDVDGNRFLDLTSGFGVAAVGHRHPKVVAAVHEQSGRLLHGLGDAIGHPGRIDLAERLRQLSPLPETQTYFAISGADAVEIAVKTAVLHHRRHASDQDGNPPSDILAFEPSYHGLTSGALVLGSRPEFGEPFREHLHQRVHRLPYGVDPDEISRLFEQGTSSFADSNFAAVIVEPIVGREGVIVPPPGWLGRLAQLCHEHGVLLIVDEIFTGFGRTGRLFAFEHERLPDGNPVIPDLVCCGKALGGGLPIAAVLGSKSLMSAWSTPGEALHTATFVAHPVACAAALATLDILATDNLAAQADKLGCKVFDRISGWTTRFAGTVTDIRGRGLLWGIELASRNLGGPWMEMAWSRGILLLVGGPEGRVAQIVPPLTMTERQLDFALDTLEESIEHLARERIE